jgi:hypothetical protein
MHTENTDWATPARRWSLSRRPFHIVDEHLTVVPAIDTCGQTLPKQCEIRMGTEGINVVRSVRKFGIPEPESLRWERRGMAFVMGTAHPVLVHCDKLDDGDSWNPVRSLSGNLYRRAHARSWERWLVASCALPQPPFDKNTTPLLDSVSLSVPVFITYSQRNYGHDTSRPHSRLLR